MAVNLISCKKAKAPTNNALIDIKKKIRIALKSRKFACGILVDLQKAFDAVNHKIRLKNLGHYGIWGNSNLIEFRIEFDII